MDNNSKINAAIRRLNLYLLNSGIPKPFMLKKIEKVRIFCRLENITPPSKKNQNNFLLEQYNSDYSKISHKIKPPFKVRLKNKINTFKEKIYADRMIQYAKYINSDKWKSFRLSIIKQRGHRCEVCMNEDKVIHAHHLTYERFMNELPEDIQLLCVDCHRNVHQKEYKLKQKKLKKIKKKHSLGTFNDQKIQITKRDVQLQKKYDELKKKGFKF